MKLSEEIYSFSYGTENGEYYGALRNEKNQIELYRSDNKTDGNSFYYSTNLNSLLFTSVCFVFFRTSLQISDIYKNSLIGIL